MKYVAGLKLAARFPVACQTRLLLNGVQVAGTSGKDRAEFPVKEPGVYRLEAWLALDGEPRPWIFANPIYVR